LNSLVHASLGEVAKLNPTFKAKTVSPDELVDFLPMSAVSAELTTVRATEQRQLREVQKGYTNFADGDVLLAKITPCFENGKIAFAQLKTAYGFGSTEFHVIRADRDRLDGRYLVHFLRRDEIRVDGARNMTGSAGQRRVPKHYLESLSIPLPPVTEQRRIAAILDKTDALRARRREALAQLDSLTQSIFIEMFGDPGSNPKGWPMHVFKDLIAGKPNNGIFKKNDEYGTGLPVVWVEELFRGHGIDCAESRRLSASEREVEQYGLNHGDILFCRSSLKLSGIGYNNIYLGENKKALFECHVIRISPDKKKIDPEFFNFVLRMPNQRQKLFKHAKTVTMSTIDQDGLLRLDLPLPPLSLQIKFSDLLKQIERLKAVQFKGLKELANLFSALQHRAFRGEL
jgi:type I restriction enzyme S subunit